MGPIIAVVSSKEKFSDMSYIKRLNYYERQNQLVAERKRQVEERAKSKSAPKSLFVFENITKSDQQLPRISHDNKSWIKPGERFVGDDYYRCVRGFAFVESYQEESKVSEKLILDQPDTITNAGKVEHTIVDRNPQKEAKSEAKSKDKETLIVEDPIDGVDVILG